MAWREDFEKRWPDYFHAIKVETGWVSVPVPLQYDNFYNRQTCWITCRFHAERRLSYLMLVFTSNLLIAIRKVKKHTGF